MHLLLLPHADIPYLNVLLYVLTQINISCVMTAHTTSMMTLQMRADMSGLLQDMHHKSKHTDLDHRHRITGISVFAPLQPMSTVQSTALIQLSSPTPQGPQFTPFPPRTFMFQITQIITTTPSTECTPKGLKSASIHPCCCSAIAQAPRV